jgi:hypothetical protein
MSTPNQPTRQQLEEIDSLLKRMLSLPPLASEAVEPAPAPPSIPPVAPYAQPTIREVPPAIPPAPGDPIVQAWRVEFPQTPPTSSSTSVASWGTPVGSSLTPAAAPVHEQRFTVYQPQPLPPPTPAPITYTPPPVPVPVNPYPAPAVAPAVPIERGTSILVWPFLIVNWVYDLLTYVLGPGGGWLRGSGRRLLGFAGIVMIFASIAWAAGNWYGYDWPQIPWQKVDLSRFGWTK